ncbi:MAG TPA: lipoyl(octanoyl) transferase LipB [Bacteroidia bacterium]|nr:lipoyl(octanoyl) transferase LipB [Bacteroidia bacterium]
MQPVLFRDLGLIDYKEAWEYQEKLFQELIERKLKNRSLSPDEQEQQVHYLLFCEHPHVYTLGRSGDENNLLLDEEGLKSIDATFYKNNRGGDITYHGPGQIVGYPILDLDLFFTDIHKYLRFLEEAIILTLKEYGISAGRYPGYTGVWLDAEDEKRARKICAIGVRTSRWVTMHGFAFNVNSNLSYFGNIVPCGIEDKSVTSLSKELGAPQNMEEVKLKVRIHLANLFGMHFV